MFSLLKISDVLTKQSALHVKAAPGATMWRQSIGKVRQRASRPETATPCILPLRLLLDVVSDSTTYIFVVSDQLLTFFYQSSNANRFLSYLEHSSG